MSEVAEEIAPPPTTRAAQPRTSRWFMLGAFVGLTGFLAMTGATCVEGLVATLLGGVTAVVWSKWSSRRGWRPVGRVLAGLALVGVVTFAVSVASWAIAPRIAFKRAFGVSPDASVEVIETDRIGIRDNTSLLIMKTDAATMKRLLDGAGFKPSEKAEEYFRPPPDYNTDEADRAKFFRLNMSVGGIFADKLPFHDALEAYVREIKQSEMLVTMITVTWDPKDQRAYVVVADF